MYTALNNSSMKTVVETFVIEETQELIYDNEKLDQWNKHVEELGLKGQTKIVQKDKSPIPFLHMKAPLVRTIETLCSRKVDVSEYDKTPIPVEILDLIALSKKEGYFSEIQIWYDDETPDPACIGIKGKYIAYNRSWANVGEYDTRQEAQTAHPDAYNISFSDVTHYLLGRWADIKMSLEQLTEKAKGLFMATRKDDLTKTIRNAQREMDDLEMEANIRFGYVVENRSSIGF